MKDSGNASAPAVCIVLVNYNGWRHTLTCLESLLDLHYENFSVVVVDNASTDSSVRELQAAGAQQGWTGTVQLRAAAGSDAKVARPDGDDDALFADPRQLLIIESEANRGFAGGNNLGLRFALEHGDFDYLWLLNNDTRAEVGALDALVNELERAESRAGNKAMCGSVILDMDGDSRIQTVGGSRIIKWLGLTRSVAKGKSWGVSDVDTRSLHFDALTGCSIMVRSADLAEIGLLREDFFMYWEDTEWCYRAMRRGFGLTVASQSVIRHEKGAASGGIPRMAFYNARNCLRFMRAYYPLYLPFCLVLRPLLFLVLGIKHRKVALITESLRGHGRFLLELLRIRSVSMH